MLKSIKISVIIPVYNTELYLKQCMDSVLGQTLKEIEVICINDGSTDNSLQILTEYKRKDDRIVILNQRNSGAAVARNKGLKIAKGIYIAFMDPDDYYPNKEVLNDLYKVACDTNALIVGGSLSLDRNGNICELKYETKDERVFSEEGFLEYEKYQYDFYYQRFIYYKKLLDENRINFPLYRRGQDIKFFVKAMIAAKKFYAINKATYCYRVGYKKINWGNNSIAIDAIKATSDIIEIARSNNLNKLLNRCILRLLRYANDILNSNNSIDVLEILNNKIKQNENINNDEIKNKKNILLTKIKFLLKLEKSKINRPIEVISGKSHSVKVSVVVPVYNVEKYLTDCLDSLCGQTLKDIEIICVNDGSTDNSLSILKKYADIDERIVVLSQENSGLSSARNSGVKFARGEYIFFCDSDDKLDLIALEELYNRAERDNLKILYFNAKAFFENKVLENKLDIYKTYYQRKKDYVGIFNGKELFANLLNNDDYFPSACLSFSRRDFLLENGLLFEPGILHEDNLWSFKCILTADCVGYYPRVFFYRRIRENSIVSQKVSFGHVYGYFISAVKGIEFLKNVKLSNSEFECINNLILAWIRNTRNIYRQLNNEEKEIYKILNTYERIMFNNLIFGRPEKKTNIILGNIDKAIKYYNRNGLVSTLVKIKFELSKYFRC